MEFKRQEEEALMHEKGVQSVIQKMQWVFSKVLLHRSPPTPHVTRKGRTFFLWNGPYCFTWNGLCCCWASCGSVSTTLLRTHIELVSANNPFGIRRGDKSLLQKHPSVLNSPTDRWLSVSGNINITGEKLIQTVYFSLCLSRKRYSSKCLKLEREARDSPWLKT